MLHRLAYRINATLENWLPEQRLFLKSDEGTRFIRLRPMTQAVALTTGGLLMAWTFIATSIILLPLFAFSLWYDWKRRYD